MPATTSRQCGPSAPMPMKYSPCAQASPASALRELAGLSKLNSRNGTLRGHVRLQKACGVISFCACGRTPERQTTRKSSTRRCVTCLSDHSYSMTWTANIAPLSFPANTWRCLSGNCGNKASVSVAASRIVWVRIRQTARDSRAQFLTHNSVRCASLKQRRANRRCRYGIDQSRERLLTVALNLRDLVSRYRGAYFGKLLPFGLFCALRNDK